MLTSEFLQTVDEPVCWPFRFFSSHPPYNALSDCVTVSYNWVVTHTSLSQGAQNTTYVCDSWNTHVCHGAHVYNTWRTRFASTLHKSSVYDSNPKSKGHIWISRCAHILVSHSTHINQSRRTRAWIMVHMYMSHDAASCHKYQQSRHIHQHVLSHLYICHTYKWIICLWVVAHISKSRAHLDDSWCKLFVPVHTSFTWLRHVLMCDTSLTTNQVHVWLSPSMHVHPPLGIHVKLAVTPSNAH